MIARKKRAAFKRLTQAILRLGRKKRTSESIGPALLKQHSPYPEPSQTARSVAQNLQQSAMAEEEDYSSLPLTDRWVHKVRQTPDSLPHLTR
jgi:hypothetical protein